MAAAKVRLELPDPAIWVLFMGQDVWMELFPFSSCEPIVISLQSCDFLCNFLTFCNVLLYSLCLCIKITAPSTPIVGTTQCSLSHMLYGQTIGHFADLCSCQEWKILLWWAAIKFAWNRLWFLSHMIFSSPSKIQEINLQGIIIFLTLFK